MGFPTETVYGVGAVAADAKAIDRLRDLKDRPKAPFSVHLPSPQAAERYVREIPVRARTLMAKAWPGPVTILLPVGGEFPDASLGGRALHRRLVRDGVIGLRCPDSPAAQVLLEKVGKPVVASSANLAGQAPPTTAEQVAEALDGRIEVLLDAGPTQHAAASTIVAFDGEEFRVVREGVFDARQVARLVRRRILFVCTGNTCRSPMAEAFTKKLLAERFGCSPGELESLGQEVHSAGIGTINGRPATKRAVEAAAARGADASAHRSLPLTNELINAADVIFCMSEHHVAAVRGMVPEAAGKTFLLDARGDVEDPIGAGAEVYGRVAERIVAALVRRMKENRI